ncbi:protein O-mannosyl-transferase family [Thermodesulfobacteriota bacterium]
MNFNLKEQIPFILIIILFGIYLSTISPVIYLGDSGEFTTAAFSLGIPHSSGYPLYALIGKIFCFIPIGNIGFRMNLMSSIFAVLTVWITYTLILKITSSRLSSLVGAFILAFTPLLWSQTVSAEVYTLHAFFVISLIRILWWWDETRKFTCLVLFTFITGISFCNHLQTLMLAPAVFFIILSGDKASILNGKKILILSMVFIVALSLYLYLPIRTEAGAAIHWGDPNNFERFFAHVTGKGHRSVYIFNKTVMEYLLRSKELFRLIWAQFGIILLLALWGWIKLPSVRWRIFFVLIIIFDSVYTLFLNIISLEITAFALPTCISLAVLAGTGIAHLLRSIRNSQSISGFLKRATKTFFCLIPVFPLFSNFSLCDQSRNYTAYEHATNMLRTLESGSTLFMDGDNNIFPLTYGRIVERMREDVTIYDRYNLFFKMPYMDDSNSALTYHGKWEDLRAILEMRIIERVADRGVYFAGFNPFAVSFSEQYKMVPFGVLRQILKNNSAFKRDRAGNVWDYYCMESLNSDFDKDFMTREVISFIYFLKGEYYFIIDKPQIGLPFIRLASEIGYNDKNIHSDIAFLLMEHGLYHEAGLELEKALVYHQDLSGVHNNWGYYYYKTGNFDMAVESFQKAIGLNPENYVYYNNLAFIFYATGKIMEAKKIFQRSNEINQNQPEIKKYLKD